MYDSEPILLHALVNDGTLYATINPKREPVTFNEKELRDAAHDEVARALAENTLPLKKRKGASIIDDKAKQSRDRNREHARNTRLRKKAYIQKLKDLSDQLILQKENDEIERKTLAEQLINSYLLNKNMLLMLLQLRSENVRDRNRWATILDENVIMTLPVTPFQYFHKNETKNLHALKENSGPPGDKRILRGIDSILRDCQSLSLLLEMMGSVSSPVAWKEFICMTKEQPQLVPQPLGSKLSFILNKEDTIAAGNHVMSRCLLRVDSPFFFASPAPQAMDPSQPVPPAQPMTTMTMMLPAMISCQFSPASHKIVALEIMFDVMNFLQQLQMCAGISPETAFIPNSLEEALQSSHSPSPSVVGGAGETTMKLIVKNEISSNFPILHVNPAFSEFSGLAQSDAENADFFQTILFSSEEEVVTASSSLTVNHDQFLEEKKRLTHLFHQVGYLEMVPSSAIVQVKRKNSQSSVARSGKCYVQVVPLTTDSEMISHQLLILTDLSS